MLNFNFIFACSDFHVARLSNPEKGYICVYIFVNIRNVCTPIFEFANEWKNNFLGFYLPSHPTHI